MKQLYEALGEAQNWCDNNGEHNTGMVSMTVDTLRHWQNMAIVTVGDLLELSLMRNYRVVLDGTNEIILSPEALFMMSTNVEKLNEILATPVYSFSLTEDTLEVRI